MAIPKIQTQAQPLQEDDWSLNPEQMLFLLQNHNAINRAFEQDDLEFLRAFAEKEEFLALFGDMGFDEVYDRYETMLESGDGT
jgi:hypothetical protein